jgi:hypothetical protein
MECGTVTYSNKISEVSMKIAPTNKSGRPGDDKLATVYGRMPTSKELLAYSASITFIGCLILAFIDPSFRPVFGEIVKLLCSAFIQSLVAKA